jgi:hypothetical protein
MVVTKTGQNRDRRLTLRWGGGLAERPVKCKAACTGGPCIHPTSNEKLHLQIYGKSA